MATPTFSSGINTVTFLNGIQTPGREPKRLVQVVDRTAGGTLQVEDLGVTINTKLLVLRGVAKATTFSDLETFFESVAEGAKNTFVYTDHDSTAFNVKFITNPLAFEETDPGLMEGELLLEVV